MKKFIVGLVIFAVSTVFMAMRPAKTYHSWNITIKPTTQRAYVDSITNAWKKDSIDLTVSKMEIGSGGILSKIKGNVCITSMG
jgi:cell division protein FtsW (lipid II flippase)